MAWCPKCKEEYREGITVCAECGTELVENIPEERQEEETTEEVVGEEPEKPIDSDARDNGESGNGVSTEDEEDTEGIGDAEDAGDADDTGDVEDAGDTDSSEDAEQEYDWDAEDAEPEEDQAEEEKDAESTKEQDLEDEKTGFVSNAMYAKKSDEYKDLKFSGFTFIFFGVLGIIYLILCKLEIIGLTYSLPIFILLVLMFVVFIGIGVHSLIKSSQVKELIGDEEALTKKVEEAMASIMTQELIDSVYVEDATEEENFLTLSEKVKERIAEQFGTKELTEAYVDQLIDEYYSEHYEK